MFGVNSISEIKSNHLFCASDYDARLYIITQNDNSWRKRYCVEISPKNFIYRSLIKPVKPSYSYDKKAGMQNEIAVLYAYFDKYKIDKKIIYNVINENSELNEYEKLINRTLITKSEPNQTEKINKILIKSEISDGVGESIFSKETTTTKDGCYLATQNAKLDAIRKLIKKRGINAKEIDAHVEAVEIIKDTITEINASSGKLTKCETLIRAKISLEEKDINQKLAKKEKIEFNQSGDEDNDPPVIEIAESFTVDSQTYTLKGKVKDKSKLYLEANGRPLKLNSKGRFEIEGFVVDPNEGDQIKLVAIDQWQNKSEKIINIKVEFKEVVDLRKYEEPNPSKIKVKQDKNKIAIIIGIEKYKTLKNIDAPYANRDANAFRAYANRALGIPNKNIKVLIDENATRGETLKALTLWLPQIARGKGKDIYIFFAGHGLASDDGKNLYILPQDGDAALLQYTAISRLEVFELINRVEPNSVTMFFDTCYSGQTRDEEMLVAGLRPIRLAAEEQDAPNNFTIFTASNYDQTSGSINEAKHGIFSYYLMKGMEGQADSNEDKKITNGELIAYLKQNVSEEAFINNRQQEPMLSGDPDKVLISYR